VKAFGGILDCFLGVCLSESGAILRASLSLPPVRVALCGSFLRFNLVDSANSSMVPEFATFPTLVRKSGV